MRRLPAKKATRTRPDETYQTGPLAFARYGRLIVAKNIASPEQMRAMHERMASSYDSVVKDIDAAVLRIADIASRYEPLELLQRAYWLDALALQGLESEVEMGTSHAMALRMVDYIQAVIVSYPPSANGYAKPTDEVWNELSKEVEHLFNLLNNSYPFAAWAKRKIEAPAADLAQEEFVHKAQLYWANIRGDRYVNHDALHLRDVLAPHEDIFMDLFGVSSAQIVSGYEKLQDALLRGPMRSMERIHDIQASVMPTVEARLEDDSTEDMHRILEEELQRLGLKDALQRSFGEAFGLDLFNVQEVTGLPYPLLREMAFAPGEEPTFFSEGAYRGWPLRVWPNWIRPFLLVDGVVYCFDLYSVKDRLYRVLQRLVTRLQPSYQEVWNDRQKATSESLPLQMFEKLLPGGTRYQSLYYKFQLPEDSAPRWYECDGAYIYDDALIAIEVKAGAFTRTPPMSNFEAYVASLRDLIVKPAQQSSRFLEYLRSAPEVPLFNRNHAEVLRLRSGDFAAQIACAVTLDAFTELAARASHLKEVGVDIGITPVWNVSIDDLRVYADLFDDPLRFLHFLEQRIEAVHSKSVDLEDEIDHLGLYLKHNHYVQYANSATDHGNRAMRWHGYRQDVDKYYHRLMTDPPSAVKPTQELPAVMHAVLSMLNLQKKPRRRLLATHFLDLDTSTRQQISNAIETSLLDQEQARRVKPVSSYGDGKLTVFCWQPHLFPKDTYFALEHTHIAMAVNEELERLLVELTYSEDGSLYDVSWSNVSFIGLSEDYRSYVLKKAEELRHKRVSNALSGSKIGPNSVCPCGSGRKFKRCCGRRP